MKRSINFAVKTGRFLIAKIYFLVHSSEFGDRNFLSFIMGNKVDISVDFAGLQLANPVLTASGTCGYADE